jgi:hypothetical protein
MGIGIAPSNIPSSSQVYAATAVKQAKPKDKPYKLADGGGLYLHVKSNGKYWRYKYRFVRAPNVSRF